MAESLALREWVPPDWVMTQNSLGDAHGTLGVLEPGTSWLEEAIAAYRAALKELTRDRVPLQWEATIKALAEIERRSSGSV